MDRNKKIIKTSILGIVVNVILVTVKFIIGSIANSISIVLDAVNNLTDSLSSIITIIGTKLSTKAPDKEHPYGHGRIEYFTSVIVSSIVLFAGISALRESINKIIHPVKANYSILFLMLIGVGVIVKFIYGSYVKKVGKKINSHTLVATGEDSLMDSILSFTTLIGALVSYFFSISIEGYLGILISVLIVRTAIELLSETTSLLLGQRADSDLTKELKDKILEFKEVQGVYDLNMHYYGPSKIIASVHIQVRNDMTAEEIHILTREIEYVVYSSFGIALTIGIYAANDKGEFGEIKKDVESVIEKYPCVLQLHGFYVDNKHNVYFDLIIDFEEKNKERIKNKIIKELKSKYKKYNFNVILDSDISD